MHLTFDIDKLLVSHGTYILSAFYQLCHCVHIEYNRDKNRSIHTMYVHQFSHDSNDASSGVVFDDTLMKMFTLPPSDKALLPL